MSEPKQYTTAIIVAVPATDDAVHAVVTEDAHVTLQFLGEAADLSEDQVAEIEQSLEMLAGMIYPFQVDISGTAELGPDKAQVLIVQSALMTKIRETLGMAEAVSTAVASADQFPNWIPHLTLAYDGEMPDVEPYKQVTIASLELWLAEEHRVYPLAQAKEAVTAAGVKGFEEGLHPRGADGRFIEKFGVIKYLTGLGWQYGKVEGINADPGTGAIKLTVTPSDLAGKTHGDSIVLSPKQVYRAPSKKAHLLTNAVGVKKVGGQGGSNPGGMYSMPKAFPKEGDNGAPETYYVKTPKSKSHGNNEALANALYEEAGVPVPEVDLAADGQLYSKIVKGQQDMSAQLNNPEWTDQVRRNFAVDAWLGNRDVFGMTYDNVLTDENGTPWRIDNGGALLYRAMGEKKTDFGSQVTELEAFRQGKKAKIYGAGMTKAQELDGAERVVAISPGQIDDMVSAHNLPKSLADTLKARRAYIASYYGLELPESKAPAEAEGPTVAPLVDAPDIAENEGHTRTWFKGTIGQLALLGETGDVIEFPDGSTRVFGVDEQTEQPLSVVGSQAQVLGWMQKHGADAPVYLQKATDPAQPRPEHDSTLAGSDLSAQRWKRGDQITDSGGLSYKVLGWNENTGAVLVQHKDSPPTLLDTHGKDANGIWKVQRWDPPVVDTPEPIQTEQQAIDLVEDDLASYTSTPTGYVPVVETAIDVTDQPEEAVAPVPGKTGQAAVAEAAIKADLDQPLPSGNGAPAPKKTSAPGGAKTMVIGDGTEAATGDAVTSKKDGKTYTFVKPKGQYAVVTDPNGEDPNKQLLKLASTMTQPGKVPAGDVEVEKPKTATGEVPVIGMMALAKDGWAGEIKMISPDGKFVFIYDANGVKKRKSTGTVSITSAPTGVPEAPKAVPGPLNTYGPISISAATAKDIVGPLDWDPADDLDAGDMVVVGYADGTTGLEPYTGQPAESLLTNAQGHVANSGYISGYLGPVSAPQLIAASQAKNKSTLYQVIYSGNVFFTDGTTGPNGGLVLWYASDNDVDVPGTDAWEISPVNPVTLSIISSDSMENYQLALPEGTSFQLADEAGGLPAYPPLYNDEAKTLSGWKGQLSEGMEISLDGVNWLKVQNQYPSGALHVEDNYGNTVTLGVGSLATYVVKAPPLVDGDAPNPAHEPTPEIPDADALPQGQAKKAIGDLVHGDVVIDGNGVPSIIDSVEDYHGVPGEVTLKAFGEDFGSPANPAFEFEHLGNLTEGPVTVPIGIVAPHLYPGVKIQLANGVTSQLVSYPELLDNGSYRFAAIPEDNPEEPFLVTVGAWDSGADVSNELAMPVHLAAFTSAQEAGADLIQLNALFNAAKTEKLDSTDHHGAMTDQGIPFGTASYPLYYGAQSETYFRAAHSGLEEWDAEAGAWNKVFGTVSDKEKVWDGKPFEGQMKAPEGFPTAVLGMQSGTTLDKVMEGYKPAPGETVQVAKVSLVGVKTLVISYPFGLDGPAHTVLQHADGSFYVSSDPFAADWKESGGFTDLTVIHDPFADAVDTGGVPHHEGPQPPPELGAKLQSLGFTPEPGAQMFYAKFKDGASNPIFLKGADGKYRRLSVNGNLSASAYTLDELVAPDFFGDGTFDTFTWTYLPEGAESSATVQGLPEGFAPFVPGDGQSVLKVTLANGKVNAYVQQQPGAGWYEMSPDGTVNESSDAVKSDYVVQKKLAQPKSSAVANYELLHPLPEGMKSPDPVSPPEFKNATGTWTPEPGQKVVSLISFPGDTDPWFLTQDAPGQDWKPAPINLMAGNMSDVSMQFQLENSKKQGNNSKYAVVYDGQSGQAAVDTDAGELPSFTGYTPKEGEQVFQETNGSHWVFTPDDGKYHAVEDDGTLAQSFAMTQTEWDLANGSNPTPQVWPTGDTAEAAPAATQDFNGYTPVAGDTVLAWVPPSGNTLYLVKKDDDASGTYHPISNGTVSPSGGITQSQLDNYPLAANETMDVVWPPAEAGAPTEGGVFGGYQTQPGDNVAQFTSHSGNQVTVVQQVNGTWAPITDGALQPDDAYSQGTIDWAADPESGLEFTVLQGTAKGGPAEAEALPTTVEPYAGVTEPVALASVSWTVENGPHLTTYSTEKINGVTLDKGESLYYVPKTNGIYKRSSAGTWHYIFDTEGGYGSAEFFSDESFEQYLTSNNDTLHKVQFAAPAAAPAPQVQNTYSGPPISGWEAEGLPNPASFGFVPGYEDTAGVKAGTWLYVTSGTGGLYVELAEDATGAGSVKISSYAAVKDGQVQAKKLPSTSNPILFSLTSADHIYVQNHAGAATAPGTQAPAAPTVAPSAPQAAVPSTPEAPAYPGAQKPSQEDINAWGGSLTKDGHIPTAGMYVTGKGPMAGKIISVSKDKSKAVVLTSDGKKTTRLIEALKTNPSANYSAYAAPVTAKDIPGGMPLAVDTVAEALQKTAQDGKFRAILNGHPGVSGGQMVVTKTTAPSGKVFNRVHLTLTPDQRTQLMATLAGTGEKGDWVKKSKQSDAVTIGDQLPMRKSSTDNPDGTPRWKVDPEQKPPTHTVVKVEEDPVAGVKLVTLKNNTTGEEITSRFHPGKSLSVYTWDPNKPKAMTAGAFSLSELAKAQGWQHTTDGGISAISGGADNGKLYNEPGTAVSKSALGQVKSSWQTLRNVSADGVVVEIADPKGPNTHSTTGVTVISVPEGADETALGAALAKMGIDYRPMNQDDAKTAVRGTLRTLLNLDTSDVDTPKHYTDEQLFKQAGTTMGISDLGWQDVLIGVDESTGKTSFFWSDRARTALAAKAKYNLVYRAASTASAAQIVSTVKYGSASSILKKTTGMLDGSGSVGNGASASSDNSNHAGHGSYASASSVNKLPSSNAMASYKHAGMMIYHRPEAVLGRIMDYRVASSDAFGMGQGSGADHLKHATSMSSVRDYFLGGGLPTEAVGFIAVDSAAERDKAIAQLKADGFAMINGRPVEDIVITKQKAATMTPDDLPPVTLPANARPILDLPVTYDAPAPAAGATTGGEAAA